MSQGNSSDENANSTRSVDASKFTMDEIQAASILMSLYERGAGLARGTELQSNHCLGLARTPLEDQNRLHGFNSETTEPITSRNTHRSVTPFVGHNVHRNANDQATKQVPVATYNFKMDTGYTPQAEEVKQTLMVPVNRVIKFGCQLCEKTYIRNANLKRHVVKEHGKMCGRIMFCDKCNIAFRTLGELVLHRNIHFREYECGVCGMRYPAVSSLIAHMQNH